ncbi:hypothetical protein Tco_0542330 [Tanacetum coccineum]
MRACGTPYLEVHALRRPPTPLPDLRADGPVSECRAWQPLVARFIPGVQSIADDHEIDKAIKCALTIAPMRRKRMMRMDVEVDEEAEEEHPAPAYPVVVALPATAPSAEETEPFETDESAATPPPHPAYRMTARITIPEPLPIPSRFDYEDSYPLSPLSPVLTAPPPSPIRSLGYRAATIRMRAEAAATSHSLPLSPPFILSPTRPDAPPPMPTSAPTSLPPLLLPSASHREDRPEVNLPPRKRLGIALGPSYEVGESSAAAGC